MKFRAQEQSVHGYKFIKPKIAVFDYALYKQYGPNNKNVQDMCRQAMASIALWSCLYIKNHPISRDLLSEYKRAVRQIFKNIQMIPTTAANSGQRKQYSERARPYPSVEELMQPGHGILPVRQGVSSKDANIRVHFTQYDQQSIDVKEFPYLNKPTDMPEGLLHCAEIFTAMRLKKLEAFLTMLDAFDVALGLPVGTLRAAVMIELGPSLMAPTAYWVDMLLDMIWDPKQHPHKDDSFGTLHIEPFADEEVPVDTRLDSIVAHMSKGYRFLPELPPAMLLFQAGIFFEYLLGGLVGNCHYKVIAGLHGAYLTPWIMDTAKWYYETYKRPMNRFADVFFVQPQTTTMAQVLSPFANAETDRIYPPHKVGDLMQWSFYGAGTMEEDPNPVPKKKYLPHDLHAAPRIVDFQNRLYGVGWQEEELVVSG